MMNKASAFDEDMLNTLVKAGIAKDQAQKYAKKLKREHIAVDQLNTLSSKKLSDLGFSIGDKAVLENFLFGLPNDPNNNNNRSSGEIPKTKKNVEEIIFKRKSFKYGSDSTKSNYKSEDVVREEAKKEAELATNADKLYEDKKALFFADPPNEKKATLPLRVFLSSPMAKDSISWFQRFLLSLKGSYGYVHAGIQIGTMRLDWYEYGVVHFRDLRADNKLEQPLVVFDPCDGKDLPKTEATLRKLCKLVVHWNLNVVFNQRSASCQDFVNAVLKEFGLKAQSFGDDSALGRYLLHLRDHPEECRTRILLTM